MISLVDQEESTAASRKGEYFLLVIFQVPLFGKVCIYRAINLCVPRENGQKNYLHFTTRSDFICPWIFWCSNTGEVSGSLPLHLPAGQATRTMKTGKKWNYILVKTEWFRYLYLSIPAYSTVFLKALKGYKSHIA